MDTSMQPEDDFWDNPLWDSLLSNFGEPLPPAIIQRQMKIFGFRKLIDIEDDPVELEGFDGIKINYLVVEIDHFSNDVQHRGYENAIIIIDIVLSKGGNSVHLIGPMSVNRKNIVRIRDLNAYVSIEGQDLSDVILFEIKEIDTNTSFITIGPVTNDEF